MLNSHDRSDLLMRWKSAQYRRTGRLDRFGKSWFVKVVEELFDTRTDSFSAHLSAMYVQDRPASLCLMLRANGILAGWFPAHDVGFSSYGVGLIHLLHIVKLAPEADVRFFDLGTGEAHYKTTFSDFDLTVAESSVSRPSFIALARRLQTAPQRIVTEFVLRHPMLRKAARETLAGLGKMR